MLDTSSLPLESHRPAPIEFEVTLRTLDGNKRLLTTIAQLLVEQIRDDMPGIRSAVAAKNSETLVLSTHKLKGALGYFSAVPAYMTCCALHSSSLAGRVSAYEYEFGRMEYEMERLSIALTDWIADQTPVKPVPQR